MWLRDSAAQVNHYIPLAAHDLHLQVLIEGASRKWSSFLPSGSRQPFSHLVGRTAGMAGRPDQAASQPDPAGPLRQRLSRPALPRVRTLVFALAHQGICLSSANPSTINHHNSLSASDRWVGKTEEIWERKYEVDSLCYFLSLSFKYWNATGTLSSLRAHLCVCVAMRVRVDTDGGAGSTTMFDDEWLRAAELVVRTWKLEQMHNPDVLPPLHDFSSEAAG